MAVKKHKCKQCKNFFEETIKTPRGRFCDMRCALDFANDIRLKEQKKERKRKDRADKQKHAKRKRDFYDNDKSTRIREAQKAFNAFIRERDKSKPCVSCGRMHEGQWHAGHYRTTGAHPELRFHEDNCHKQCSVCNNHKSGNIADYRIELVKRIGLHRIEWLEGYHAPQKYACEELKEIELKYKQRLKELQDVDNI